MLQIANVIMCKLCQSRIVVLEVMMTETVLLMVFTNMTYIVPQLLLDGFAMNYHLFT